MWDGTSLFIAKTLRKFKTWRSRLKNVYKKNLNDDCVKYFTFKQKLSLQMKLDEPTEQLKEWIFLLVNLL